MGEPYGVMFGNGYLTDDAGDWLLDSRGRPQADPERRILGNRLRRDHDIDNDGLDTFERVRQALSGRVDPNKVEVPHDVLVALLLLKDGKVALVEGRDGLTLPRTRGSG